MLANLALRKPWPNIAASERAMAELVTVIQSIRPDFNRSAIWASGWVTSRLV